MPPEVAPRFDLVNGFHPEEHRFLSEEEDILPLDFLRMVYRSAVLAIQHPQGIEQLALLWLKLFPDIDNDLSKEDDDFYESLWKKVLKDVEILEVAYAFYPIDLCGDESVKKRRDTHAAAERIQRMIEERLRGDSRTQGKIIWTLPFPADGPLGKPVEDKIGLSLALKQRIGLNNYTPVIEGIPTVAYVQAKRYSTKKVGIREVKEFVATVAGDKIDQGIIVTTSYFSKDSAEWLQTKGVSLANVEFVDRVKLEARMRKIADAEMAAYLLMK